MAHCANHEINYLRDMSAQRVQLNTTGRLHIPAALNHNENIQYLAIKKSINRFYTIAAAHSNLTVCLFVFIHFSPRKKRSSTNTGGLFEHPFLL